MSQLGYVRLKCLNVNRTVKFYTACLKFVVKRRSETDSFTYVFLGPSKGEPSSGAAAAASEGNGSGGGNAEGTGGIDATETSMRGVGDMSLRFECERFKQMKFAKAARVPVCSKSRVKLVMYVKSIREVTLQVERSNSGAWLYSLPQRCGGVLIATLVDPNGVLVQLVELPDTFLKDKDGTDKLSFAASGVRFGYAVIKSDHAVEHARYYEALFRPRVPDITASALHTPTPSERKMRLRKSPGLSIVDQEHFPEALAAFVWVGSGSRAKSTTLCFMEKVKRAGVELPRSRTNQRMQQQYKKSAARPDEEVDGEAEREADGAGEGAGTAKDSLGKQSLDSAKRCFEYLMETKSADDIDPLLGVGIIVADLPATVVRLQRHLAHPVTFIDDIKHQEAIGDMCSFVDSQQCLVDLVDQRSAYLLDHPKARAPRKPEKVPRNFRQAEASTFKQQTTKRLPP